MYGANRHDELSKKLNIVKYIFNEWEQIYDSNYTLAQTHIKPPNPSNLERFDARGRLGDALKFPHTQQAQRWQPAF